MEKHNTPISTLRLLQSTGFETFIKYFEAFEKHQNDNPKDDLIKLFAEENWKQSSKETKANTGCRIFRTNLQSEALYIISKSVNISEQSKEKLLRLKASRILCLNSGITKACENLITQNTTYNGEIVLMDVLEKENRSHLICDIIAEASIWANPKVYDYIKTETPSGAWFPLHRRANSEKKGTLLSDGTIADDNTYANQAVKKAILGSRCNELKNFQVCHIYDESCKDNRYHTTIPNLVLLPRALASLTDYFVEVKEILQYRSFELYNWHPEEVSEPNKPTYYPKSWRYPEPYTTEIEKAINARR